MLKKIELDESDPANYRPIFNLNTVIDIPECLFLAHILPHVTSSPNYNRLQYAYRRIYPTETVLLKMANDINDAIDSS